MMSAIVVSASADQWGDRWRILTERDADAAQGFFYGVTSTGVYCRPSCPSRRPQPANVRFFDTCEDAERAGFRACLRCRPQEPSAASELVQCVVRFIDAHPGERVTLNQLSAAASVSPFHLQRVFKKATGVTPRAYAEEQRKLRFHQNLRQSRSVTEAIYDSGFNTSSRAYDRSSDELGMAPRIWRKLGEGAAIRYTITPTEFGQLLVASTDRGLCAVRLGHSSAHLEAELRRDFAKADLRQDDALTTLVDQVLVVLGSSTPLPEIPLDVRATAFQRRVWEQLRAIPRGETRTYSQVAAGMGAPTATRAVARACATNPVSLVVPCHRVIGKDGNLRGFRWGLDKKRQLLAKEKAVV